MIPRCGGGHRSGPHKSTTQKAQKTHTKKKANFKKAMKTLCVVCVPVRVRVCVRALCVRVCTRLGSTPTPSFQTPMSCMRAFKNQPGQHSVREGGDWVTAGGCSVGASSSKVVRVRWRRLENLLERRSRWFVKAPQTNIKHKFDHETFRAHIQTEREKILSQLIRTPFCCCANHFVHNCLKARR